MHEGATTVRLVVDGVGYVEPLLTEYEKLHALHSPADCHVSSHGVDDKEHITEKRGVDIVKQEIWWGDNEHIAIQHHAAKRHIAVFIHHCGYHIGATTTSAVRERDAQAHATEHCADNDVHKRLLLHKWFFEYRAENTQEYTEHGGTENGANHKLSAHHFISSHKQYHIDDIVGDCNINCATRRIINNGGNTSHTTRHHIFRDNERRKTKSTQEKTEHDHHIIFRLIEELLHWDFHFAISCWCSLYTFILVLLN